MAGTDYAGMVAWMDRYCEAHPLDPIGAAAIALVMALSANPRNASRK